MSTFNPDDFLNDIQTAETVVTVFKRADLVGKLQAVENELALFPEEEDEGRESSLEGNQEKHKLIALRDEYQEKLGKSAVNFTLRAIDDERIDKLTKEAHEYSRDRANEAAKEAAGYAREELDRGEVADKQERRDAVRNAALSASRAITNAEAGYFVLLEALVDEETGKQLFTSVEQIRKLAAKLGATQMRTIRDAFYDMNSADPASLVPKSKRLGPAEED